MAFRSKACVALSFLIPAVAWAQSYEFPAVQKRLWRDKPATVRIDTEGIHAAGQKWVWDDIQQLTLAPDEIRVLTYADAKWRAGRDREWTFEHLPKGKAAELYPFLRERLDVRFVPALAVRPAVVLWEAPMKLRNAFGGSEGTLVWGDGTVAYDSAERDASRTWRIQDIEGVSSGGVYDLTITTAERQGLWRGGPTDFRFQFKRPMPEDRYQALWRQVHRSKGLDMLHSQRGEEK